VPIPERPGSRVHREAVVPNRHLSSAPPFVTQTVCLVDIVPQEAIIEWPAIRTQATPDEEAAVLTQQDAFYAEVGRRVRHAHELAGLTQDTLAARVALSRTSVTNIEGGRQKMMLHTLWELASALGVEPTTLLPDMRCASYVGRSRDKPGDEGGADLPPRPSKRNSGRRAVRVV
jgi:DNA-binding XRE family transcriptional regulator